MFTCPGVGKHVFLIKIQENNDNDCYSQFSVIPCDVKCQQRADMAMAVTQMNPNFTMVSETKSILKTFSQLLIRLPPLLIYLEINKIFTACNSNSGCQWQNLQKTSDIRTSSTSPRIWALWSGAGKTTSIQKMFALSVSHQRCQPVLKRLLFMNRWLFVNSSTTSKQMYVLRSSYCMQIRRHATDNPDLS